MKKSPLCPLCKGPFLVDKGKIYEVRKGPACREAEYESDDDSSDDDSSDEDRDDDDNVEDSDEEDEIEDEVDEDDDEEIDDEDEDDEESEDSTENSFPASHTSREFLPDIRVRIIRFVSVFAYLWLTTSLSSLHMR